MTPRHGRNGIRRRPRRTGLAGCGAGVAASSGAPGRRARGRVGPGRGDDRRRAARGRRGRRPPRRRAQRPAVASDAASGSAGAASTARPPRADARRSSHSLPPSSDMSARHYGGDVAVTDHRAKGAGLAADGVGAWFSPAELRFARRRDPPHVPPAGEADAGHAGPRVGRSVSSRSGPGSAAGTTTGDRTLELGGPGRRQPGTTRSGATEAGAGVVSAAHAHVPLMRANALVTERLPGQHPAHPRPPEDDGGGRQRRHGRRRCACARRPRCRSTSSSGGARAAPGRGARAVRRGRAYWLGSRRRRSPR